MLEHSLNLMQEKDAVDSCKKIHIVIPLKKKVLINHEIIDSIPLWFNEIIAFNRIMHHNIYGYIDEYDDLVRKNGIYNYIRNFFTMLGGEFCSAFFLIVRDQQEYILEY